MNRRRQTEIETHRNFPVLLRTTRFPSSTSYYKVCTKYFLLVLRNIKLAQGTSHYSFLPQNLHKELPGTTSYYRACAKYVLQSLRKVLPSTTSYHKICPKTSQSHFVLQSLHRARPSTTSYYKICTNYFPSTASYYKAWTEYVPLPLVLRHLHQKLPITAS